MHRGLQCASAALRGWLGQVGAARTWMIPLALALTAWLVPAIATAQSAVPVYRFFNDQTGTHFYTTSTIERDIVLSRWPQFLYEGPVFYAYLAPTPDTKAVYRFFDTATSTHFYTQSETERDQVIATQKTYIFEGPVYYTPFAAGTDRAALFRFYNTRTHARFYTDNPAERDQVLRLYPWFQLEGIGFYVFTSLTPAGSADDSALKVALTAQPITDSMLTLTAIATDNKGFVTSIDFMMDGVPIGSLTREPFSLSITVAAGTHVFTAVAHDTTGATRSSEPVSYTLAGPVIAKPRVSLAVSTTTVTLGQPVTLVATASEDGGTIKKVGFYSGAKLLTEIATAPYMYTYTPAAGGTLSFNAIATDTRNVTATSSTILVTVNMPVAGTLKVTLSSSTTFTQVPATFTLTANPTAGTGTTISKVEFLRSGAVIGTVTVKPYTLVTTLATPNQTYAFTARVTDNLNSTATSTIINVVTTPTPAVQAASLDVWRLLTQATFGPAPADVASAKSLGIAGWVDNQFMQPQSGYPDARYNHIQLTQTPDCASSDPAGNAYPANSPQVKCVRDHLSLNMVQRDFFTNAVSGRDQLRQRVSWALSQILVTSANEKDLSYAYAMSRYQNILFNNAFGNFETLLQQVSLSPAMGNYLDAVNNDRPDGTGRVPNENYAREIMQLFSIGVEELKEDGTPLLDNLGNSIATYGQDDIKEMARVFTGWTYANPDGSAPVKKNSPYYATPMANFPGTAATGHDADPKMLVNNVALPAGQSALQDLNAAVHAVFMHPNTPVFISKQLIQKLVTGSPSPEYVQRIVNVFKNNGGGARGDLRAVVRAILLDPEARGSADKGDSFGSLREPVFVVTSLIRSLSGVTDGSTLGDLTGSLGQRPYYSPTVFNYFQPDTSVQVQGKNLVEPEFGIHDSNTAFGRANLVYRLVYNGVGEDANLDGAVGTKVNTQQLEPYADDPTTLVNQAITVLTGGTFATSARDTIAVAVAAITMDPDPAKTQWRTDRARMAVYLIASSYYFQVQH